MKTVYRLRDNERYIAMVQRATVETADFGIQPTHGLFGSDEWWKQIADGRLPLQTLRGTIARTWMGSMNDWPECEVVSDSGEKSTWTRYADDSCYQCGNRIEIDYVVQWHKPTAMSSGRPRDTQVVVEVRIG